MDTYTYDSYNQLISDQGYDGYAQRYTYNGQGHMVKKAFKSSDQRQTLEEIVRGDEAKQATGGGADACAVGRRDRTGASRKGLAAQRRRKARVYKDAAEASGTLCGKGAVTEGSVGIFNRKSPRTRRSPRRHGTQ